MIYLKISYNYIEILLSHFKHFQLKALFSGTIDVIFDIFS